MSLKILSVNCNGVRGSKNKTKTKNKRDSVFKYLKEMDYDIYCLQETHFTKDFENTVKEEWDGTWFFSHNTNRSSGVAILFTKAAAFGDKNYCDVKGRCLMIEFCTEKKWYLLCCIYGYNEDKPDFYKNLLEKINEFSCENVIICGDFNLVLNPKLDYENHSNLDRNIRARKEVLTLMKEKNLVDIFREMNPKDLKFTWENTRDPPQKSRLDFFLISKSLQSNCLTGIHCIEQKSIEGGLVDHSIITLSLNGEGLWEFNNSFLSNEKFVKSIKEVIQLAREKFPHPSCKDGGVSTVHDQTFLEKLLEEIKVKCILYSTKENHSETIHEQRRGAEEGESRNILSGIIPRIKLENGQFIYEQSVVLEKTKEYYKELYSNVDNSVEDEDSLKKYFSFPNEKKLSDEDKSSLDAYVPITWKDAKETLDRMKSNDTPGSDGFTLQFFSVFGENLGHFVVRSINNAYDRNMISKTQRHGIITCLPKVDKPKHFLVNWRPTFQLNTVYKIASGSIAYRIQKHLEKIIHPDQTGFIHGSKEAENIRLVYDIMQNNEKENIPGLLLLVNFEKAFDSVSWSFIQKALEFFNFGESIRNWIRLFHSGITAAVNQGGNISETFDLHRGCREGDPLSPYLFMICAEILAIKIRESNDINGIKFLGEEKKISIFADDTLILMLDGSRKSLQSSLSILKEFAEMSGIHINLDEAKGIWVGSSKCSDFVLKTNEALQLGEKTFKLHGIEFDTADLQNVCDKNFRLTLENIREILRHLKCRNSTSEDVSEVLETIILPSCQQIFSTLPNPSDSLLEDLESELYYFAKGSRHIPWKIDGGGIKEIVMSLKLLWMKDILLQSREVLPFDLDSKKISLFGRKYIQNGIEKVTNMFWKDVLMAWLHFSEKLPKQKTHPSMEPLFYNKNILSKEGEVFYHKSWFEKNIVFVNDVLNENGSIMNLDEFKEKYEFNVNSKTYTNMSDAIEEWVKKENVSLSKVNISHKKYIKKSLWEPILNLAIKCNPSLQMYLTM